MHNEKYPDWRSTMREYAAGLPGFDKEAAWVKLQQRKPVRRRKPLYWAAAAVLAGLVFWSARFLAGTGSLPESEKLTHTPLPAIAQPKTEPATVAKTPETPVFAVPAKRQEPATAIQNIKKETAVTTVPQNSAPLENEPPPVIVAIEPVQPKENIATPAVSRAALKIVHLNELQVSPVVEIPPAASPPVRRGLLGKPVYVAAEGQEPPPELQPERKRTGLLRTIASIKE